MVDFTAQIIGNVTGFDTAPIDRLNASLKQVPASANTATSGATNFTGAVGRVASGSNSAISPINTLGTTTRTAGSNFSATGAIANSFGSSIATTGSKTTAFTGSLNSMNTGLTGVQGGLSNTNTLHQNLATSTANTTTKQQALTTSIGLVATGFSGLVGTGVSLFEMYDALGDAQVAVQGASARLITAQAREQSTQRALNKIIADGKTGTLDYNIAVQRHQAALEKLPVAENNVANAQEALNETYAHFVSQLIPTVIQGISSAVVIFTALRGAGEAAAVGEIAMGTAADVAAGEMEVAEGATAGLGAELIAIAAPAIAAVALFALIETNTFGMGDAFRSITPQIGTAIDAIVNGAVLIYNAFIKSLEAIIQFGADTANTLIGVENTVNAFLDSVATGFINLGQDIQTAVASIPNFFISNFINPVIRAWNSFTQGLVTAWQSAVNSIVDFFKPAALAIIDVLKKIVDAGALIPGALGDAFRQAKTGIDQANESLKKVGTQVGTTGDQAKTGLTPLKELPLQAVPSFQHLLTSGLYPANKAFIDASGTIKTLDGTIIQNAGNIKTGAAAWLNWASRGENLAGVVKGQVLPAFGGLLNSIVDGTKGIVGMIFPTDNLTNATKKNADGNKEAAATLDTLSAAQKKFADDLDATIQKQNAQSAALLHSIETGQNAAKTLSDLAKAMVDANAKNDSLSTSLTNATAVQLRYNTAITEGANKFLELVTKTQDAVATQNEYNSLLESATGSFSLFNGALEQTPKNMELVAKAALGDKDALKDLQDQVNTLFDDFNKLGDTIANDLGKAMEDGSKSFKKALKDLAEQTGIDFDEMKHDMSFKVAAGMADAKDILQKDLGAMNIMIRGNSSNIGQATEEMIGKLTDTITKAGGEVTPEWQKIFDDMRTIAAKPMDKVGVANALGDIKKQLDAMGLKGPEVDKVMSQIASSIGGVGPAANGAAGGVQQLSAGMAAAADLNQGFARGVDDATGSLHLLEINAAAAFAGFVPALEGVAQAFNNTFKVAVDNATGSLHLLEINAALAFAGFVPALQGVAVAFNNTFKTAVDDATGSLNNLEVNAALAFAGFIPALQGIAVAFNQTFAIAVNDASGQLNILVVNAAAAFASFIPALEGIAVGFNDAFQRGVDDASGQLVILENNAADAFVNIINALADVAAAFNESFARGVDDAAGSLNQLTGKVDNEAATWINAFNAVAVAMDTDFRNGTKSAGTAMNGLTTNVTTNSSAMVSHLGEVKSAMDRIGQSASSAKSQVSSLISEINSIPTNKTVTIHIIQDITQRVHQVPVGPATVAAAAGSRIAPAIAPRIAPAASKKITVEVKEPTIIKVNERELIRLINRKLLELDIGAIS